MSPLVSTMISDALDNARDHRDNANNGSDVRRWAIVVTELEGAKLRALVAEGTVEV